jgi:hypothetical protein
MCRRTRERRQEHFASGIAPIPIEASDLHCLLPFEHDGRQEAVRLRGMASARLRSLSQSLLSFIHLVTVNLSSAEGPQQPLQAV